MKKVTTYISNDGVVFSTKKEAERYEKALGIIESFGLDRYETAPHIKFIAKNIEFVEALLDVFSN